MSWQVPLTISCRVASVARLQPAARSGILSTRVFLPQQARWISPGGRRGLSSNLNMHERTVRKQWTAVLVLSGSALGALFLYRQAPARMDSLRDGVDTARQSKPARNR